MHGVLLLWDRRGFNPINNVCDVKQWLLLKLLWGRYLM